MDINARYAEWVNSSVVSAKDKAILKKMSPDEKADAFFKDIEFGTAGMRGVLGPGTNRINSWTIQKATVAFGQYLLEKFPEAKTMGVAISHDNRHQSREFTSNPPAF
jgi:phosphoglucomutase